MSPRKIIWTPQSQRDSFRNSKFYWARRITAQLFVKKLKASVNRLRRYADGGAMVVEVGRPNVREIFQGQYRIIYRIAEHQIDILTVFHGARLLDPSDF